MPEREERAAQAAQQEQKTADSEAQTAARAEKERASAAAQVQKETARAQKAAAKQGKWAARAEAQQAKAAARAAREAEAGRWRKLDNNANLFPVITSRRFSNVYRVSVNLAEPVAPELLQQALVRALPWFAAFRVRLRHGLFWHYLEPNPATPTVAEEDDYPCRYIDPQQNNDFLFRITYYEKRVNLEVFHVLTDGTGALAFLQGVVCQYLMLAHPAAFTPEDRARRWFAEHASDTEDSYTANYLPVKKNKYRAPRAYKLKGERDLLDNLSVVHAQVPTADILALCRAKGVSVSMYLIAALAFAVYTQQLRQKPNRRPVNVFLPVNLRGMFGSNTSVNFFSNVFISISFNSPDTTFDEVLAEVKRQFDEKVTREGMLENISYTVGGANLLPVRMVPLPVKNAALRLLYEQGARGTTLGFTNMGAVRMPTPFAPHIAGVSLMLSAAPREPLKCAVISYGEHLCITLTSALRSVALQRAVVRTLAADGLAVTVQTNGVDYESL